MEYLDRRLTSTEARVQAQKLEELKRSRYEMNYGRNLGGSLYTLLAAESPSDTLTSALELADFRTDFALQVDRALQSRKPEERKRGIKALMDYTRNLPPKPKP